MAIHFNRKTNRRTNNIYQVKSQIRARAERLRRQQMRDVLPMHLANHQNDSLFSGYSEPHFIVSGRDHYHEYD